jgi:hypothetical protein
MLQTWANLNHRKPKTVQEIIIEPLWQNDLIQIDKKPVVYKTWKTAGITKLYHLLENTWKNHAKKKLREQIHAKH